MRAWTRWPWKIGNGFGATLASRAVTRGMVLLGVLLWLASRTLRLAVDFARRLDVPRAALIASRVHTAEADREDVGGMLRNAGRVLVTVASVVAPIGAGEREKLGCLLRGAGFGHPEALTRYLAVKGALGLVAAAATWIGTQRLEQLEGTVLIPLLAAFGAFIAGGVVSERGVGWLANRRKVRMSSALPDALDLMVMCREAGLTFERALETVSSEFRSVEPHLAREFALFERELRVGGARQHAIMAFAERTPVEGIRALAFVLLRSDRYGTPLTESLTNIAENERSQRAARIIAQAERLPVLMTLPMLLFVVPGTVLLAAGPAFLSALSALGDLGSF